MEFNSDYQSMTKKSQLYTVSLNFHHTVLHICINLIFQIKS